MSRMALALDLARTSIWPGEQRRTTCQGKDRLARSIQKASSYIRDESTKWHAEANIKYTAKDEAISTFILHDVYSGSRRHTQ